MEYTRLKKRPLDSSRYNIYKLILLALIMNIIPTQNIQLKGSNLPL
jgi:hypothetical protein